MNTWILSSSWMILAVLFIRWAFSSRISMRLRYGLWLLVLIRLLIPVNFFESTISIQTMVPVPPMAEYTEILQQIPESEMNTAPQGAASAEIRPGASAGEVLTLLWITGSTVACAVMLGSNWLFAARLRRNRCLLEYCISPVPIYVSEGVDSPCLVGLFRPIIYVTPETAKGSAFDHVLAHELTHLRHFDHVFSLLRCLALALHWFNPLVWLAVMVSREDGELACDEGTLAWLGDEARAGYGETLIQLTCQTKKGGTPMLTATTMTASKKSLRTRIRSIAGKQKSTTLAVALVILLSLLATGCAFTDAPETTAPAESTEPAALDHSPTPYASRYYNITADEEELALLSALPMWREEIYPGPTWTSEDEPEIVYTPVYYTAVGHKLDYKHAHDAEDVQITDVVKLVDTKPEREESMELWRITYDIILEDGHETEYFYFRWYGYGNDDGVGGYGWTDDPCHEDLDFRMPDGSMP